MDVLANGRVTRGAMPAEEEAGLGMPSLLDELAHGILITTAGGRVVHANQAAQHELARKRVLTTHHSVLQCCAQENDKALRQALSKVSEGKRSVIELAAPQGPGLTLAALPLKVQAPRREPRAALIFARASVCDALMLCFFARSHGLTATEEQVLGILCQGLSAPQIAIEMKVAVSTVRSHIRSLCGKACSSGVRELVSRLAVLPPVAPQFWDEPMH